MSTSTETVYANIGIPWEAYWEQKNIFPALSNLKAEQVSSEEYLSFRSTLFRLSDVVRTATSNPQFYLRGFSIALGTGYEYYKISSTGHFAVHHILMNHEISDCFLHGEIDPVLVEGLEAASLNPFIDADQGPAHYRNVGNTTNVGTGELQSYAMLIQHSQRQEEKIAEKEAIIYELELARKNMESHVIGLNQELQRKEEQIGILKNENE